VQVLVLLSVQVGLQLGNAREAAQGWSDEAVALKPTSAESSTPSLSSLHGDQAGWPPGLPTLPVLLVGARSHGPWRHWSRN
jgi:hypothetical protein